MITRREDYAITCSDGICLDDVVLFTEIVWKANFSKPAKLGKRDIVGRVVAEHPSSDYVTLELIESGGKKALYLIGAHIRRTRRVISKGNPRRMRWASEAKRATIMAARRYQAAQHVAEDERIASHLAELRVA